MNTIPEFRNRKWAARSQLLARPMSVLLLCLAGMLNAPAQTYTILHSFGTNMMGLHPSAPLVQGPDGTLYGTTGEGGTANRGQVFKVNPDGSGYRSLKDFTGADGAYPVTGLLLSGMTLFGTTGEGESASNQYGTVFKLNTDGTGFTVLKEFDGSGGQHPYGQLVISGDTLYGTTAYGGGYGSVFKVNTNGNGYEVLKVFTLDEGSAPYDGLTLSGTELYGVTAGGGSNHLGTVFKLNTDGSGFRVLKHFRETDGAGPQGRLALAGATLYGNTSGGGANGQGTIFKLNTDGGSFTVLKDFNGSDGAGSHAALLLSGTSLYGMTSGGGSSGNGSIFKLNTNGTDFTILKELSSDDGICPSGGLVLSNTVLYGTAFEGGESGFGTVFKLNTDGSNYAVLTNFTGGDGSVPGPQLALSGSTLYGPTDSGGHFGSGTIYKVNTDGSAYSLLKEFEGTGDANATLQLADATLFGTTVYGGSNGYGTVFKMNLDGSGFTVLKDFGGTDGAEPYGGVLVSGATIYGTTTSGGSNDLGIVFRINTDGTHFTVLKDFSEGEGGGSFARLALSGTSLYGTTCCGGTQSQGTVFRINTDGTGFTVLKNFFGSDGSYPAELLVSGSTIYGTTSSGGMMGQGTAFVMGADGSGFSVLRHFTGSDGDSPAVLLLSGSTLYGTTSWGGVLGQGTVFRMGTDGSGFSILKHFTGSDGAGPRASLLLSGTTLYGTTAEGGNLWCGVLFSLSPGLPTIVLHPLSQTVGVGNTFQLAIEASGWPAPAFQWFFNSTNAIGGATSPVLELTNVQFPHAGNYTMVVSNSYGSVTSLVATLTVEDPFIAAQPVSQSVNAGQTVLFTIEAGGTSPLSYQWFKNGDILSDGVNVDGARKATLRLTNVFGGDAGGYSVVVTNAEGSVTSQVATLSVADPFIVAAPASLTLNAGETAQFSVAAEGTQPLAYQWLKDGGVLNDAGNVSGAQTPTLTLSNVLGGDQGEYSVLVTDAYGSVSSLGATLRVIIQPPVGAVTVDFERLSGMTFYSGNPVSVAAKLSDQLLGSNGVAFSSESGMPYIAVVNLGLGHATSGTNGIGGVDLNNLLSYQTPIWASFFLPSSPAFRAVTDFVSIRGDLWCGSSEQMRLEAFDLQGNLLATDTADDSQPIVLNIARAGIHSIRISGGSSVARDDLTFGRLTPAEPPQPVVAPAYQTIETGMPARLTANDNGSPSAAWQWYFAGQLLNSATNHAFGLPSAQAWNAGAYVVVASNTAGAATSAPAMLQVIAPVERRPVPGIHITGQPGGALNLEFVDVMSVQPEWSTLDSVPLGGAEQDYFDLTLPLPAQRFYRGWQTGESNLTLRLDLQMIPALTLAGSLGDKVRVDGINAIGPTNAWFTLDTVTLTNTSQLYFDVTAPSQPRRLYRLVPLP